ncbi:MAG: transcription termination factor NusA [Anaerolineae bacterium]
MKSDLAVAIKQLVSARELPRDIIVDAIEAALIAAYKKTPQGSGQNVSVKLDAASGKARVFAEKEVVEEVKDPRTQISLAEAVKINELAKIGDRIQIEVTPRDFGRIAAQTAKQVILQRIREAERDHLYKTYTEQQGEIVSATVQSLGHDITVNLGKAEAILPRDEQMATDSYYAGQRLRVYILDVKRGNKGPKITVSRRHPLMLRRLLELEVPEIFNGTVEIKAIAREAGSRSKVAVTSRQEGIDPVGACVGVRGVRIQALVNELGGEKIDVVEWDPDPARFIANALSPAVVVSVTLEEDRDGKTANVVVPDRQLSLAIGKEGQNARLAAKLTGWRIDIRSETEAKEEAKRRAEEEARRAEEEAAVAEARALLAEAEGAAVVEEAEEETPAAPAEEMEPVAVEVAIPTEPEVIAETVTEEIYEDWLEEEEEEEGYPKKDRKKKRRRKQRLIYDEELGEVVATRRRKPGRRQKEWEEELERWEKGEV